jgi:hypothetical protein
LLRNNSRRCAEDLHGIIGDPELDVSGVRVASAMLTSSSHLGHLGFPSNREGFLYGAAGWSAASISYWIGDINAAEPRQRVALQAPGGASSPRRCSN